MLEFSFAEIEQEAVIFKALARDFVFGRAIDEAVSLLQSYRYSSSLHPEIWAINDLTSVPFGIKTITGKQKIASISLNVQWPIEKISSAPQERFRIVNDARSGVDLSDVETDTPMRSWIMAISPAGERCVLNTSYDAGLSGQFDTPFFPSLAISPFGVAEHALAEFLPGPWARATTGSGRLAVAWRAIQRRRLVGFLDWARIQCMVASESPWVALRRNRPPADLFAQLN